MADSSLVPPTPETPVTENSVEFNRHGFLAFLASPVGRQILLIAALLLIVIGVNEYSSYRAEEKASDWLTSYNGVMTTNIVGPIKADFDPKSVPSPLAVVPPTPEPTPSAAVGNATGTATGADGVVTAPQTPSAPAANLSPTPTPIPTPNAEEKQRLKEQLQSIRDRIRHHAMVMAFFFEAYYVAIVMVMFAGVIAAVTLFFIAQKGWEHTSNYIETVFIFMSAVVAFYALFPPVFQQEKNITDNKQLFLAYKALESEVESYPVTHRTIKNEPKPAADFINHIDSEMERLGNIALGFDITKINYSEAIQLNQKKPQENAQGTPSPSGTRRRR